MRKIQCVCEELQPMGRTHTGGVCAGLSPVGGTPCCSWARAPLSEKKATALIICGELIVTLSLLASVAVQKERKESSVQALLSNKKKISVLSTLCSAQVQNKVLY